MHDYNKRLTSLGKVGESPGSYVLGCGSAFSDDYSTEGVQSWLYSINQGEASGPGWASRGSASQDSGMKSKEKVCVSLGVCTLGFCCWPCCPVCVSRKLELV